MDLEQRDVGKTLALKYGGAGIVGCVEIKLLQFRLLALLAIGRGGAADVRSIRRAQ